MIYIKFKFLYNNKRSISFFIRKKTSTFKVILAEKNRLFLLKMQPHVRQTCLYSTWETFQFHAVKGTFYYGVSFSLERFFSLTVFTNQIQSGINRKLLVYFETEKSFLFLTASFCYTSFEDFFYFKDRLKPIFCFTE